MGKTYKLIICGKKGTGKTTILENLIYNNGPNCTSINNSSSSSPQLSSLNLTPAYQSQQRLSSASSVSTAMSSSIIIGTSQQQQQLPQNDKYFSTIEDMYVACWEKDKGLKEKFRFYDTKGLENAKDIETINFMRHLFSSVDAAILVFSSLDADSAQCIEKLKSEIEKSKDKKETCHFIIIDNVCATPVNVNASTALESANNNRDFIRQELQNKLKANFYELNDKRENLYKPFIDLFTNITQLPAKGSMNIVQSIKKPKVFSSNK